MLLSSLDCSLPVHGKFWRQPLNYFYQLFSIYWDSSLALKYIPTCCVCTSVPGGTFAWISSSRNLHETIPMPYQAYLSLCGSVFSFCCNKYAHWDGFLQDLCGSAFSFVVISSLIGHCDLWLSLQLCLISLVCLISLRHWDGGFCMNIIF